VIEKKYKGKIYHLSVIKEGGVLRFKVSNKIFTSLTAAAKYLMGTDRETSGPRFWGAPISKN
jgi:hypothetical protein